ncbi:MAG: apolipoprotein N-acyltransferase [Leptolyngbya sp.]|nr:apolipoprotein N-acyltransferase [Candidatus Melainabacteria bacterium]
MTRTATKKQKKDTESKKQPLKFSWPSNLGLPLLTGSILGLSAPGMHFSLIAWVGLAPLFLLIASSKSAWQAFIRGTIFGTAFNLVYQNWYLGLQPLDWLGFNGWQGWLLACFAWFVVCFHQGLIIGLFSLIAYKIPMTGTFFPEGKKTKFRLPALIILPLAWVLVVNLLGNAHSALGVPFAMLEYTQYKQISMIQCASVIGGIGLCFFIVMTNAVLAALFASFSENKNFATLKAPTRTISLYQALAMAVVLTGMLALGFTQSAKTKVAANIPTSVVQQNINIDMQKTKRRYGIDELFGIHKALMATAPGGLSVWTESSLPTYLSAEAGTRQNLSTLAREKGTDLVVGAMDYDNGKPYNSAYGITSGGAVLPDIYHKRYLVPVGEYAPAFITLLPDWAKKMTNTPAGGGFTAGNRPVVLAFNSGRVGPLICFETISPESVTSTVRAGAEILVNISDLAWFHDSVIGEQMIASSVLRAVENHRYVVFAANTGPSAIIDPTGKIINRSQTGKALILTGMVGRQSEITPFTSWFRL